MIIFGIIVCVFVGFLIIGIIDFEKNGILIFIDVLIGGFGLGVGGIIRDNGNPELKDYLRIKKEYKFILSSDSVPFEMKQGLYNECTRLNDELSDNKLYHNSIWVGFYYPELESSEIKAFDLTKIK